MKQWEGARFCLRFGGLGIIFLTTLAMTVTNNWTDPQLALIWVDGAFMCWLGKRKW